jgi:pilus assembly protein TadC
MQAFDANRPMKIRSRLPRAERRGFQPLPLPFWLRLLVTGAGWFLVVLGVLGIFLPVLQGGLSLALGFALLSITSQAVHLRLRRLMGRWPRLWKRMERLRRKVGSWLQPADD